MSGGAAEPAPPGRKKRGTGQLFGISPFAQGHAGAATEWAADSNGYRADPNKARASPLPLFPAIVRAERPVSRQGIVVTGLEGAYARFNGVYYPDARAPQEVKQTGRPHLQRGGDGTIEYWSREGVPGWVINQNYGSKFFYNVSEAMLPPEDGWKKGYGGMLPVPSISYTTRQEQAPQPPIGMGSEYSPLGRG